VFGSDGARAPYCLHLVGRTRAGGAAPLGLAESRIPVFPMRRISLLVSILTGAAIAACSVPSAPSGPQHETPYAVLYGHVTAPRLTHSITVIMAAYDDSTHAIMGGTTAGYAGNFAQLADTANNFIAFVPASPPGSYFLNIVATGQGATGYVSSTDTVRALRVQFDSATGGRHDSLMVNFTLP
jgi:hypothetical protein